MPSNKTEAHSKSPNNILMFIDGLGSGGAQKQFADLAAGLASRGHFVTVAVYNDQDHFAQKITAAGIEIVRITRSRRWSIAPVIGLVRLYRRSRADVVIAFLRTPAILAELARLISPHLRVIASERSVYLPSRLPLRTRASQSLHHLAAFVAVNSRHQRLRMQHEFASLSDRLVTIHNAVAVPRLKADIQPFENNVVRFVAIGSLMRYKNSILLAQAISLARDEYGIIAQVSWVGETFEHLGEYGVYRETCAAILDRGLQQQWNWMGAIEDVNQVAVSHDALIHPSKVEGTSNAICEAMALGLPVLASRIADHEELIERSGTGLLFDGGDARSIARRIADFASLDVKTREVMAQRGRRLIEHKFSKESMIARYEALVNATIDGSCLPPAMLVSEAESRSCAA